MSVEDINVQYSPSFWSKRFPREKVVNKHIEIVKEASELAQERVKCERDVSYGKEKTWIMDVYGESLPADAPIFVYIHGGYWQSLDKNISSYCVEPLFKEGIRVIIPDYNLAPEVSLGEIVAQIKDLATFILKSAQESGVGYVWFGGHSAGGHLAACLLDEQWLKSLGPSTRAILGGLVLISGIYDLTPLLQTEVNEPLKLTEEDAIRLSPLMKHLEWFGMINLHSDFLVLMAVAENDSPAFQEQTTKYYEYLKVNHIKVQLQIESGLDHFDIVEKLNEEGYELTKLIISLIKRIDGKSTAFEC